MELVDAIELYLFESRQIDALAQRQARIIGECIPAEALRNEAVIIVLLTLAALQKGSPRVDKDYLLKPLSRAMVESCIESFSARNPAPARWADVLCGDLSAISAALDTLFENPSRYAPITGCVAAEGSQLWPVLVIGSSYIGFSRYWCSAQRLEEKLIPARLNDTEVQVNPDALNIVLQQVFVEQTVFPEGKNFHFRQVAAAALACRTRFLIVSGGPGTGKTSVVVQILRTLLRLFPALQADRTVLCAPTGRAKARLATSINEGLDKLAENRVSGTPTIDDSLRRIQRKTLHSLLGQQPDASFTYHRDNRLPFQLVIVDEVSMVDLNLFASLLEALDAECRLVLVGDMHQLPSVDAGALLGDLTDCFSAIPGNASISQSTAGWIDAAVSSIPADGSDERASLAIAAPGVPKNAVALIDHTIILSHSYRSSKGILDLADAVNRGDGDGACSLLRGFGGQPDISIDTTHGIDNVSEWCNHQLGSERMLRARAIIDTNDISAGVTQSFIDAANDLLFDSIILTLAHDGPRGRRSINSLAEKMHRQRCGYTGGNRFFHGQPVIVGTNHHHLDIYNGDLGIVIKTFEGLKACFPRGHDYRVVALDLLADPQPAYALTVHKAQGSEFGDVLLVLPENSTPLLTRQILYTGITRAKNRVRIIGSEKILRKAITTREERVGGVVGRMKDHTT